VIQRGTGQTMSSYNVNANSIAGKTGTTNDNSDLWFMGYTPQMLAGAWVGCDDRFLRFTDNYIGQGAHAAMPIWAYFMEKVTNDHALNLDNNANFQKPANMVDDYNVDFISKEAPLDNLGPEINLEEIGAESNYQITNNTPPVKQIPISPNKTNKEAIKPKAILKPAKKLPY